MPSLQSYVAQSGAVGLSASATRTMLYIKAPTGDHVLVRAFGVSFDAAAAGQGVRVEVGRITTLGTPTASTPTSVKKAGPLESLSSGATVRTNVTASEPTMDVVMTFYCAPNGGGIVYQFPLGEEFIVKANDTNDAFALRVVTPTGVTPNCAAWAEWQE